MRGLVLVEGLLGIGKVLFDQKVDVIAGYDALAAADKQKIAP